MKVPAVFNLDPVVGWGALLIVLLWSGIPSARAASSVSVEPQSISGDAGGWIAVQAEVTTGSRITIAVVADLNANGTVDPGETVFRYHTLTEGQAPLAALSPAPGDTDGLNAHLETRLDFWDVPIPSGAYVVRVDDGASAAETALAVTLPDPGAQPASISGFLRTGEGAPVAGLVLIEGETADGADLELSKWTDSMGAWNVQLPAGDYQAAALAPGYLTDCSLGGCMEGSLAAGQSFTGLTLNVYQGERSISGRVIHTATGLGIPHAMVSAEGELDEDHQMTVAFTDENGDFVLALADGSWRVGLDPLQTSRLGLLGSGLERVSVQGSDLSGFDFHLSPATTYIAGTVTRHSDGVPLEGLEVLSEQEDTEIQQSTITRADGSYVLPVTPAIWRVGIEPEDLIEAGYLPVEDLEAITGPGDPALGIDFSVAAVSAHLDVILQTVDTAQTQSGMTVWVSQQDRYLGLEDQTDAQGTARFGLRAGEFSAGLIDSELFSRGFAPEAPRTVTLAQDEHSTLTIELDPATAAIQGSLTGQGDPVSGVDLLLFNDQKQRMASTVSDSNGHYGFPLLPGTYAVQPEGSDLIARNLAPLGPVSGTVAHGEEQTIDFACDVPETTLTLTLNSFGFPLEGITLEVASQEGDTLAALATGNHGQAVFGLSSGAYGVSIDVASALDHGFLPREDLAVTLTEGQQASLSMALNLYSAYIAAEAVVGLFSPDPAELSALDTDGDGSLGVDDVVRLVNRGR